MPRFTATLLFVVMPWPLPTATAQEKDPASAILDRITDHDIVLVGENPHRGRRIHEVYARIVAHPDVATHVDDVMVEFGNARLQPVMDRYLLELAHVPSAELERCWRDTTKLLVWDSPVYEAFFMNVRALNETLELGDRVGVLLGAPPSTGQRSAHRSNSTGG